MMQNQKIDKSIKKIAPVAATAFVAVMLVGTFSLPAAFAAVTFDPETGTGFVGKGEVQTAFGWNNQKLQANAKDVSFSLEGTTTYDVTCEWDTVTGKGTTVHHDVTIPRHIDINSEVVKELRNNKPGDVTGFKLTGFGADTGGVAPALGDPCPGNHPGTVTEVVQTGQSPLTLYVTYSGTKVALGTF